MKRRFIILSSLLLLTAGLLLLILPDGVDSLPAPPMGTITVAPAVPTAQPRGWKPADSWCDSVGDCQSVEGAIAVPAGVKSLRTALRWRVETCKGGAHDSDSYLSLALVEPDGTTVHYTFDLPSGDTGDHGPFEDQTITIADPVPGTWAVRVTGDSVSGTQPFRVHTELAAGLQPTATGAGTYNNFTDPGTPYVLTTHKNGTMPTVAGGICQLTDSVVQGQVNSICFDRADAGAFESLRAEFDFQLSEPTDSGADGMGLVVLPTSTAGDSGVAPVFHSEYNADDPDYAGALSFGFDICYNATRDNNDNHVSLHWNGSKLTEVDLGPLGLTLEGGGWIHADIAVVETTGGCNVTVTLDDGTTTATPLSGYFVSGLTPYQYRVAFIAKCGADRITTELDNVHVRESATIGLSNSTITASCKRGSSPVAQSFTVANTGTGTLNYTVTDDADWLSCSPGSGDSTGEADTIDVNFSASGLGAGIYTATITVSGAGTNSPQEIDVSLTVTKGGGGGGGCSLAGGGADPLAWMLPYVAIAGAWALARGRKRRKKSR
jgi:Viral BACON domain/Legume lectin domain